VQKIASVFVVALALLLVWSITGPLRTPAAAERPAPGSVTKAERKPADVTPRRVADGPQTVPRAALSSTPATSPTEPAAGADVPSTPIPLDQVLQPNRGYRDAKFGLTLTYPEGWTVHEAIRWGVNGGENTVFFKPAENSQMASSVYYRSYADGPQFDRTNPEATLRDMARQKQESRSGNGTNDYKNDPESFVFRTIDGHPSLSYFATYTQGDQIHAEYFLRVLGEKGYVMSFTRGPVKEVQAAIPAVFQMGGTIKPP
jgi:hypothetical protein